LVISPQTGPIRIPTRIYAGITGCLNFLATSAPMVARIIINARSHRILTSIDIFDEFLFKYFT